MDRTVPRTGSEEIELYMRTYYSLLRSTHAIQIETLAESHMAMESSLHVHARSPLPDISALVYSSLRLPPSMADVEYILAGQVEQSFIKAGYPVTDWKRVYAPGRRRRTHFDGQHTLAVFIASRSDIDDLMPMLTAYQIEWNKLHALLQAQEAQQFLAQNAGRNVPLTVEERDVLAVALHMETADVRRLEIVWDGRFIGMLERMAQARKHLHLQLLAGSQADYRRGTVSWWAELQNELGVLVDLEQRPVYFVSSNTHSILNLLTGFARREEGAIIEYMKRGGHENLLAEYAMIQGEEGGKANLENFLYYVLKKYLAEDGHGASQQLRADEQAIGIHRIPSRHGFDIETQVIELGKLRTDWLDPRVCEQIDLGALAQSDALILNIDYPLGLAAYEILARVTEHVASLHGVYVMGKAATLNGRIGDIMIPNVVHDEHSQNTYLFNNCFTASDVAPYSTFGMVLDNQKAISALGTFLQNPRYMSVFYREGYTDIEMESGPYLSSIYEAVRPQRHPYNEIVTLHSAPFDVGFLHYASDTPLSKGHNLGASNLSYAGVEPTYAAAVAIVRQILRQEMRRLRVVYGAGGLQTVG
jgi:hypothetical protein